MNQYGEENYDRPYLEFIKRAEGERVGERERGTYIYICYS